MKDTKSQEELFEKNLTEWKMKLTGHSDVDEVSEDDMDNCIDHMDIDSLSEEFTLAFKNGWNRARQESLSTIEKLKAELEEERKVVDFYAGRNSNWIMNKVERHEYSIIDEKDIEKLPTTIDDGTGVYFGGKLARERQAKRGEGK